MFSIHGTFLLKILKIMSYKIKEHISVDLLFHFVEKLENSIYTNLNF